MRPNNDRFVSGQYDVLSGPLARIQGSWNVLQAINGRTSNDIAELRRGLDAERRSDPWLNNAWERAILEYRKARQRRGHENWARVNCPDEYHIALVAYTLETPFYRKFNKATRTATMATVKHYPYKNYFKLLWLSIKKVPGHPRRLSRDVLYRGLSDKMKFVINDYVCFQHFMSTSRDKEVAKGFIDDKRKGTLFRITGLMDAAERHHFSCLDHFNPYEEEVLIIPTQVFQVVAVEKMKSGLKIVHLHSGQIKANNNEDSILLLALMSLILSFDK